MKHPIGTFILINRLPLNCVGVIFDYEFPYYVVRWFGNDEPDNEVRYAEKDIDFFMEQY